MRPESTKRIVRIHKRDGRDVAYDRKKIVSAVARAEAAVQESTADADTGPTGIAEEVGALVERLLERKFPDPALAIPGIEDVQDLVERALIELGAASVAKAYILYRDKRAQVRAALVVREDRTSRAAALGASPLDVDASAAPGAAGVADIEEHAAGVLTPVPRGGREPQRSAAPRSPRVAGKDSALAWSKGRIVAALMSEADVARARAEEIAARVESRVFASGLRSISTALIRELVDNELAALGCEEELAKQRPIGVPRHDLRRLLGGARRGESPLEDAVAAEILERYAVEDLLPRSAADLVRAGELAFEDLTRPHLPLALALPVDLFARADPGPAAARTLLAEAGRLARAAAHTLVLEGAETLLEALRTPASLEMFLGGLAAVARASGRRVEIVLSAPRPTSLAAVLAAFDALEREAVPGPLPALVLDAHGLVKASPEARSIAARLLALGHLAPSFSAEGERYAGPGLARPLGERGALACGAAVVLNLPRMARRAGAWREDALFAAAAEHIESALEGLAALRDFQRATADRSVPYARVVHALSPVGLREALEILGDGEVREEQAARLLAFLGEACERLGTKRGLPLSVTPFFGERAAAQFARADAAQFRVRQPWLFAEPARVGGPLASVPGAQSAEPAHSLGFALQGEANLRALLGAVPTCALHPLSALRMLADPRATPGASPGASEAERLLDAWDRLARLRGRTRGGSHAIYALPPLLARDPEEIAHPDLFAAALPTASHTSPKSSPLRGIHDDA